MKKIVIPILGSLMLIAIGEEPQLQALRLEDDAIQPIFAGWSSALILPGSEPGRCNLLQIGRYPDLGQPIVEWTLSDQTVPLDENLLRPNYPHTEGFTQLPLFERKQIPSIELPGGQYVQVPREDGLFDLINTASRKYLINTGTPGHPEFSTEKSIPITDPDTERVKMLLRKAKKTVYDINSDGNPDLLFMPLQSHFPYWPGSGESETSAWSGNPNPDMGSSTDYRVVGNCKGYDIVGTWLGRRSIQRVFWAAGSRDTDGNLQFGTIKPVYYGNSDVQVQWKTWSNDAKIAGMHYDGKPYILMFADTFRVVALPILPSDDGELRCDKARPLLESGLELSSLFRAGYVGQFDFDRDGKNEIILGAGSFGGFAVLKGSNGVGSFREAGRLYGKGGYVETDAMACITRIDWDGDGFEDIVNGDASGVVSVFPGTADPLVYKAARFIESDGNWLRHWNDGEPNLQGPKEDGWNYIKPVVADWNNDGHLDLICNDNTARLFFYEGTADPFVMKKRKLFTLNGNTLPIAWRSKCAVTPDGKLLFMDVDGDIATATPAQPGGTDIKQVVKLRTANGGPMNYCGPAGLFGRNNHAVCDWDQDGIWDLLIGVHGGLLDYVEPGMQKRFKNNAQSFFLRNSGTNAKPVFEQPVHIHPKDKPYFELGKHIFSVWPTHLDGDKHWDLLGGNEKGMTYYWFDEQLNK